MKKIIFIALTIILVLGLVACGNTAESTESVPTATEPAAVSETTGFRAPSIPNTPTVATEPTESVPTESVPTESVPTEPEPTEPEPEPSTELWTKDGKYKLSFLFVTSKEPNSVRYYDKEAMLNRALEVAAESTDAGEDWLNKSLPQLSEYDIAYFTVGGECALCLSTIGEDSSLLVIESVTLYGYPEEASHTIENALLQNRELRTLTIEDLDVQENDRLYAGRYYHCVRLPEFDHGFRVTAAQLNISINGDRYHIDMANWTMMSLPPR